MGPRRAAREVALRALYALDLNHELLPTQAVACVINGWAAAMEPAESSPYEPPSEPPFEPPFEPMELESHGFALRLVKGAVARRQEVDRSITDASTHWRLERMAVVDRAILRLATAELLEASETPAAVVISEAVELGKMYGSETSASFINGVLDAIVRKAQRATD